MESEYNYYFFIGIVGTNRYKATTFATLTLGFEKYPTMDEILECSKEEYKDLSNVLVLSFSELTPEQHNKLYPKESTTDDTPEETTNEV